MNSTFRDETDRDVAVIDEIVRVAFLPLAYSSHTEEFMIRGLRKANALTISLVAESDGQLVGHVAFSPIAISDGSRNWFGLGPLAVRPEFQGPGIGRALVSRGLERLRGMHAVGCVVFGNPDYYGRFGFRRNPEIIFEGAPPKLFQALKFIDRPARGKVNYHEAFEATE